MSITYTITKNNREIKKFSEMVEEIFEMMMELGKIDIEKIGANGRIYSDIFW